MENVLEVAKVLGGEIRDEGNEIGGIVEKWMSENNSEGAHEMDSQSLGGEGESAHSLIWPSMDQCVFILRHLQAEGFYFHAALLMKLILRRDTDNLTGNGEQQSEGASQSLAHEQIVIVAEEMVASMLQDTKHWLAFQNNVNNLDETATNFDQQSSQYFLDVDLCQKFLAFHMLTAELASSTGHANLHANSLHSILQSFLDFQFEQLAMLNDTLNAFNQDIPISPQIISNYIYTFLLCHLFFSSNILTHQCSNISQFLQRVVMHASVDPNFVHTYHHLYHNLFSVLLQEENFSKSFSAGGDFSRIVLSTSTSIDSNLHEPLSHQSIEDILVRFHKETLPLLENILQALFNQSRRGSAPQGFNAELLLNTYDQLVTLLNTCHIQFNQKTFLFDSQDIAGVWNRSFHQDTLLTSVRSLIDSLFHEKQREIIDDALHHAQKRIESYLSELALPLNRIKLQIDQPMDSATQTKYFAQNTSLQSENEPLNISLYLWQNLNMSETLLLNRFGSHSVSSILNASDGASSTSTSSLVHDWKINYQSFDPLVNSITNHIFSEILIREIHNVYLLVQRERDLGAGAMLNGGSSVESSTSNNQNESSIEETLCRSILHCMKSTIYPYIQQQVGHIAHTQHNDERYKFYTQNSTTIDHPSRNTETIVRNLFFGRLAQAVEESFNQLMQTVSSSKIANLRPTTIGKANEEIVQTLNDIYIDCHRLWIEYVCDNIRELLSGVDYYDNTLSPDDWPLLTIPDTDPAESIRIPYAPSPFILRTISSVNHHIFNIGSYKLKNQLLPILCEAISTVYVTFFSSFLQERINGEGDKSPFKEHSALQLLFDLRVLACILFSIPFDRLHNKVHANTAAITQHQSAFVQLVDHLLEMCIDAINWETYEKFFMANLQSHLHHHYLHYGLYVFHHVTTQKKRGKSPTGDSATAKLTTAQNGFIPTSQSIGAPFTLLPVQKTQLRSNTTDPIATQDQTTSKIASFFKGFGW